MINARKVIKLFRRYSEMSHKSTDDPRAHEYVTFRTDDLMG